MPTAVLFRLPTDSTIRSRASDANLWVTGAGWNAAKLLELSDMIRAALAKGKRLSFSELEDLNFVLDMLVGKKT